MKDNYITKKKDGFSNREVYHLIETGYAGLIHWGQYIEFPDHYNEDGEEVGPFDVQRVVAVAMEYLPWYGGNTLLIITEEGFRYDFSEVQFYLRDHDPRAEQPEFEFC